MVKALWHEAAGKEILKKIGPLAKLATAPEMKSTLATTTLHITPRLELEIGENAGLREVWFRAHVTEAKKIRTIYDKIKPILAKHKIAHT